VCVCVRATRVRNLWRALHAAAEGRAWGAGEGRGGCSLADGDLAFKGAQNIVKYKNLVIILFVLAGKLPQIQ